MMATFTVVTCNTCNALVIWTVTEATGKRAPVDAEPVPNGNIALEARPPGAPLSRVIPADQRDGKPLRVNHFVTCKQPPKRSPKQKAKQGKATRIKDHLYQGDGAFDHNGNDRCTICLLPKHRCPNRLPDTPEHIRDAEAQRYGEKEQTPL